MVETKTEEVKEIETTSTEQKPNSNDVDKSVLANRNDALKVYIDSIVVDFTTNVLPHIVVERKYIRKQLQKRYGNNLAPIIYHTLKDRKII